MKDDYVKLAQDALEQEKYRRHEIPQLMMRLLESDQWKERNPNDELLEPKSFDYFPAFVEESRPWGLEIEWKFVSDLCRGYEDVEYAIAKSLTGKAPDGMSHIIKKTPKQKQLIQLEEHRPDLLEKVQNRELSANSAMIEAGFIKPRIKAVKEPGNVAEMIKKHFSSEEIAKIIKILME
ncbi:MAG: hypothetical protein COB85_09915 [Bacteroidetes bacterium]|nr:MAG: hypothetical protein COB85_09915 [Bacteroidota bacterium]